MSGSSETANHHWWPVGLQSYWSDRNGDVSWIEPDGKIDKKRAENRKIAYKRHGHTTLRGSVWKTNFEDDFQSADNAVRAVVNNLLGLKSTESTPEEFLRLIKLIFKRDRSLRNVCRFYDLDEGIHRKLLMLLISLLIRSPAKRFRYETYPTRLGLPYDEEVGKLNINQFYRTAKELCETGSISNQYFVLLHSPRKTFNFGDGSLDWLTSNLRANRISGRALLPLTPQLCVYVCTPREMRPTPNCASLNAAPWMVDWINKITQIYSRDKLFFVGKPPVLTEAFRERKFLEHSQKTDEFIDMLDEVAGIVKGTPLIVTSGIH